MTSDSKIFFTRTLKSIVSSFLLVCVTVFFLSLRWIFSLTLYMVLYLPVVLVAVSLFVLVTSRNYARTNKHCANRFSKIIRGLSIQSITLAAVCAISALLLSSLNLFCHDESVWSILNVGCAMAGALFCYERIYFKQEFHFPIIQTTKYAMFMSKLSENILKSMKKSVLYVFLVYSALYTIESKACASLYFFVTLWFSISLILHYFYSIEYIVYLTMTERIVFPIKSITQDSYCLLKALNTDNKIIKSLALYDLYQATINDPERRKQIFSLSFAGNVPQSWKIIFNHCTDNIKSTTKDMKSQINTVLPKLINRRNLPNARLIQINGNVNSKQDTESIKHQNKLISIFEKFHVYNYFFGPLPKEKTLEEFEVTIWCCYILSNLAVVSLKEDEYGIVREQLGQIVSTILDLKNQLELQRRNFDTQKTKKIEYFKTHVKTCAVMLALHFAMYANDIGLDETQLYSFKKLITLLNNSIPHL